jgi:hypothetical protein
MNSTTSRQRKSPSSKARKVGRVTPCAPSQTGGASVPTSHRRHQTKPARQEPRPTNIRQEFRAWRASLPTQLERDTLLTPEWIAASVVQETERFLQTDLPASFAERLAAKAHRLYPRHKHFHKVLNRPGNAGRDYLYMYMRHWTYGWLKRERYTLYKNLPWSFGQGRRLPVPAAGIPKIYSDPKKG